MTKKIVVFACGGTGVNIGNMLERQDTTADAKAAAIEVCYIDTSEANVRDYDIKPEQMYIFEGIDGSGSDRTKNSDAISDASKDVLQNFSTGDLHIVIHSMGGGSGSVIGPALASQLLAEGKQVIVMAVQTTAMIKHLKNTVAVFKTFEAIAKKRKRVLPILLVSNDHESESNVDRTVTGAISMLSLLFSGNVNRLDSADLEHWLNFNKVTSFAHGTALLDITTEAKEMHKGDSICAVATIAQNPNVATQYSSDIEYQTVGYISTLESEEFAKKALHFVLIDGPIKRAFDACDLREKEAEKAITSRKSRAVIEVADDEADDNGLVY